MNRTIKVAALNCCFAFVPMIQSAYAQQNELFATSTGFTIDVIDARPVSVALQLITNRYPIDLTYEDPRYTFYGDLEDITLEVRTDLHLYADPRNAPRVIVPTRNRRLRAQVSIGSALNPSEVAIAAIETVIAAQHEAGSGGRFRVERSSDAVHVVPTEVRNENGEFVPQDVLLSTRITIPAQELSGLGMVSKICEAVSLAISGTYSTEPDASQLENVLKPRRVPTGTLGRYRGVLEADNEPVRDVLLRMLRAISDREAWQVFVEYDPVYENYWISIRALPVSDGLAESGDEDGSRSNDPAASHEGGFLMPSTAR